MPSRLFGQPEAAADFDQFAARNQHRAARSHRGEGKDQRRRGVVHRQPDPDGSRPGQYYINTTEPETRPRYEAEALAYHESIPGHHLQIAIAQESIATWVA